jgi:hypothetical protein
MTETVVSRSGSSNAVGSANSVLPVMISSRSRDNGYRKTDASKTPKEKDTGVLSICRGLAAVREQVVRPVSTLYVAFGKVAARKGHVRFEEMGIETTRTISKCGHHRDERGVKDIAVVVDARSIYVQHPDGF